MKILSKIALFIPRARFNRRRKRYLRTFVLKSECKGNANLNKHQNFFKENSKIKQFFRFVQQKGKALHLNIWYIIEYQNANELQIVPPTPLNLSTKATIFWKTWCFFVRYCGLSGLIFGRIAFRSVPLSLANSCFRDVWIFQIRIAIRVLSNVYE